MLDFISNNVSPFATGVNFLYANRMSRSYAAGAHEQRFLCSTNWIERTELFVYHAQKNVEALCSESFAKRFSYLSFASYVVVPALYYLSKSLEDAEDSPLKKAVDFTFSHIPDIILIASTVQAVIGLYFGVNLLQNSVHLTFYLWSFLEQGMYWDRPIENSGPLFKYNDGNLVRSYDSILGTINSWIHLPISFFCGGLASKVGSLMLGFCFLPKPLQSALTPSFIKEKINSAIQERTEKFDLNIANTPTVVNRVWLDYNNSFEVTQKHFEPFRIQDYFPSRTLDDLEKELEELLSKDSSLSPKDRDELRRLLGTKYAHGLLYNHAKAANDESELAESVTLMKNIFGALAQNWEKRKTVLLFHKDDFLCKTAIADTIKSLCLELIPEILQPDKKVTPEDLEKNRVESSVKLVLQQLRDLVFTTHFQSMLAMNEENFTKNMDERQREISDHFAQIQKIKNLTTRQWWNSLYSYGTLQGQSLFLKFQHYSQQASATSRHQITANRVLFGKLMGLSGYQEAKRDCELMEAASGLPKGYFSKISKETIRLLHPVLKLHYLAQWRETLVEAIIDLGDKRIAFSDVRNLILKIAEERDAVKYEEVYEHATACFEPSAYSPPEVYDRYYENGRLFLHSYLPFLLHELGYLKQNEDAAVDHWNGIHDYINQEILTQ